ncbi:hypothetical protein BKI52_28175 [marine bacterium AO1-C]|nr:hypothetical protein BKI52_28175 [marine bacterium AO1-C]
MSLENTKPNPELPDENSPESEEALEGKASQKKKRRFSWFRFFGRLFLVFGLLLGLVYLVAYFYFNSYLRKEIIRQVSAKTDSLYALKIDYIGINLFTSTLQVKRAHFQKNPQKWNAFKQQYPDTNYLDMDAQLDRLRITGIRWVHFLKTGEVKIKNIIFQKPKIKFHGKSKKKLPKKERKPPPKPIQALAKALGKFASDLTIEKIQVEDGEVDFSNQSPRGKAQHQLEHFSTEVQKVRLIPQETLPDTQALQVKRFAFKAKKYAFTTPDQVYAISLEEFNLNSYDSTLQLAGIKVKPHFAEQNRLNNLKKHKATFVNVDLDSLTTNRLDLYRLITKQEISLGGLFVHSLQLEITRDQSMPRQIKQKKRNLKQILANLPLYIRADTLALKNASIKYLQKTPKQKNEPVVAHKADSIHLYLRHVALGKAADSITRDKLLYSESVDLEMHNYQHQTPDGLYKITLDKTQLSSQKSLVNIENASVKPQLAPQAFALKKFYRSVRVDAKVQSVQFTQLDIEKLVYDQEFLMKGLYINRPQFKAYTDKRLPKRPTQKYQNFEQMLQSIPLHVVVDTLAIKDASLEYIEQQTDKTNTGNGQAIHKAQNMNVLVQRIQLGKALRSAALAGLDTKSLWIDVKNYRFKTPDGIYEMLFKDLEVSSARSLIEIDSLQLRPLLSDSAFVNATKYRKPLLKLALADVKAQQINFDKLLLYQEFDWGKLYLNRPQIDVFVDKRKPKKPVEADTLENAMEEPEDTVTLQVLLRNLPLYIKVDTFSINNARLQYREQVANATKNASGVNVHQVKRFDCMIPQIRLGRASREDSIVYDFYSPDIVVNLDDYEFREKNGVYKLSLKDLHSSFTDSQILLEDIKLQPLISREEFSKRQKSRKPLWDLSFKSISAHEINLEKLIFNKQINLHALHLNEPNVKLYLDKLKPKDSTKAPKTIHQILGEVPIPVKVDTFLIYDANFYLTEHRKKGNGEHLAEKINLISQNFHLSENREERQKSKDLLFMQDIFVNLSQYRYITPDQLHVISLNNVAAALSDSSLQLQHLSLKPRVSEQDFDSIKQYRALRIDAELAYFNAQKVDFRRLFNGRGIEMKRLNLDRLHLDFYQNNNLLVNPTRPYRTLQQQLASIPLYISIDSLHLKNSFANLRLLKGQQFQRHRADSIALIICKFKLDSMSRANPALQKTLFADDVSCRLKNYQTQSPNRVYNIRAKQINASTRAKTLTVNEFSFEPPVSDSVFNTYFKVQEDRFKISSQRLGFRQFQFDALIRKGELRIGSLNADRFMMDIFRDRRKPPRQNKVLMLNDLVRKVPFLVKLDTLNVKNSFVLYGEKVPQGMGFGQVFFTNVNLRATNIQTKAPDTNLTVIRANTRLMGRGFIETTVKIPLLAPNFECAYYGQMGKMEAKFFNTMITANDHIFIRRGQIRKVRFNVQVRDSLATGELLADYRRLKITVLRKKNHQRKRGLITFIANLIIKHTNNLTKKRYKKGKVKYQFRKDGEYQNSFVGVLWRALSTGLVDTIK